MIEKAQTFIPNFLDMSEIETNRHRLQELLKNAEAVLPKTKKTQITETLYDKAVNKQQQKRGREAAAEHRPLIKTYPRKSKDRRNIMGTIGANNDLKAVQTSGSTR